MNLSILFIIISFCFKDLTETSIKLTGCINVNDKYSEKLRLIYDYSIDCSTK